MLSAEVLSPWQHINKSLNRSRCTLKVGHWNLDINDISDHHDNSIDNSVLLDINEISDHHDNSIDNSVLWEQTVSTYGKFILTGLPIQEVRQAQTRLWNSGCTILWWGSQLWPIMITVVAPPLTWLTGHVYHTKWLPTWIGVVDLQIEHWGTCKHHFRDRESYTLNGLDFQNCSSWCKWRMTRGLFFLMLTFPQGISKDSNNLLILAG